MGLVTYRALDSELSSDGSHVGVALEVGVDVAQRKRPGSRPRVKEHADLGLDGLAKGVEEPAVGVELAPVFGLGGKHDLQGGVGVKARVLADPACWLCDGAATEAWSPLHTKPHTTWRTKPHTQRPTHASYLAVYSNRCTEVGCPMTLSCSTEGE